MEIGIDSKLIKKLKPFLVPVAAIVVSLLLGYFAFQFHTKRITLVQSQISKARNQEDVLKDRLKVLQRVQVEVEDASDIVTAALPQYNPSIFILSHIKRLATTHGTSLDNLSMNSSKGNKQLGADISIAVINFELEGDYESIMAFLTDMQKLSPIVNISSLTVDRGSRGALKASVSLNGYFSPLPEKLPAITEKIDDLSDEEKGVISIIKEYVTPQILLFAGEIEDGEGRTDPFEAPF